MVADLGGLLGSQGGNLTVTVADDPTGGPVTGSVRLPRAGAERADGGPGRAGVRTRRRRVCRPYRRTRPSPAPGPARSGRRPRPSRVGQDSSVALVDDVRVEAEVLRDLLDHHVVDQVGQVERVAASAAPSAAGRSRSGSGVRRSPGTMRASGTSSAARARPPRRRSAAAARPRRRTRRRPAPSASAARRARPRRGRGRRRPRCASGRRAGWAAAAGCAARGRAGPWRRLGHAGSRAGRPRRLVAHAAKRSLPAARDTSVRMARVMATGARTD